MQMLRRFFLFVVLVALVPACRQAQPEDVMLHTDRSKSVVSPLLKRFAKETGISVSVQYGGGKQMAMTMVRDSASTSADVFWGSGTGPLGVLQKHNLLTTLPDSLTQRVAEPFRDARGAWVGLSGRGHVLAYTDTLGDAALPSSVFALADSSYEGSIGWSTSAGSFRNLVTTMRLTEGRDSTRKWLKAVYEGGAHVLKPGEIVGAVADGDISFALTTQDDFYRTRDQNDSLAARITYFRPGDSGNLIEVSAIGVLRQSDRKERALRLVRFLLSTEAQQHMANNAYEYPLAQGVSLDTLQMEGAERLPELAPRFDLNKLRRSDSTRALLREVGIL